MGKIMEWLKNNWLIVVAVVLLVVAGGIFAVLMGWRGIIDPKGLTSEGDLLRSLILCIGGMGGAYGLHLAKKRQETFSHQGFNDRLGRGVESLANDNIVIRSAGVRVLADLFTSANKAQKSIVVNIIYDFFHNRAMIQYDKNGDRQSLPERESRQDVQYALDFLVNLPLDARAIMLPDWFDNGRLKFNDIDFSYLDFNCKALECIDFFGSYLYITKFKGKIKIEDVKFNFTEINDVHFHKAEIKNSVFNGEKIVNSDFNFVTIEKSNFSRVIFERTSFFDNKIVETKFHDSQFIGGSFMSKNKIEVSSSVSLPNFICTSFADAEFDFLDKVDPDKFFTLCCYNIDSWPSDKESPIEPSRGYFWGNEIDIFVMPEEDSEKEDWSGQPKNEWIDVEFLQTKLHFIKRNLLWIGLYEDHYYSKELAKLKREQAKVKKELQEAKKCLKKSQKYYGFPEKTPQIELNPKPKAKKPNPKPTPKPKAKKPNPKPTPKPKAKKPKPKAKKPNPKTPNP